VCESEFGESSALHVLLHPTPFHHCGPHMFFPFQPDQNVPLKGSLLSNTSTFHSTPFLCPLFHSLSSSFSHQGKLLCPISCFCHTASLLGSQDSLSL